MRKVKQQERTYVGCISIKPHKVSTYARPIDGFKYSSSHSKNAFHLEDNEHNGIVSKKAQIKIEDAVSWLVCRAKNKRVFNQSTGKHFTFKVNFITLTLPSKQVHTDAEIKDKCLQPFLNWLRKKGCQNYLWRAEAQPTTGNIHFHLTTDFYLHYDTLRAAWNRYVNNLQYVNEFSKKFGHANPNSTDIHAVKHIKKLAGYLSKYLSKSLSFPCVGELRLIDDVIKEVYYKSSEYQQEQPEQKRGKLVGHILGARVRPIEGRLWGCSSSLSGIKPITSDSSQVNYDVYKEFVIQSGFRKYTGEFATIFYGDVIQESEKWFPQLHQQLTAAPLKERTHRA